MTYLITVLLLVNSLRSHPLIETTQLDAIAQNRAEYICLTGKFSHENFMAFFVTFKPGVLVGENLAQGFNHNPYNLVGAWYASQTHRENVTNPKYHFTGLGYACGYTVELFTA